MLLLLAGLQKLALSEVSASLYNRKKIQSCIFRESINGEEVEIWGELHRTPSGSPEDAAAIRIRVRMRGGEKNVMSFNLGVTSKSEEDRSLRCDRKYWSVTDWMIEDSKVFKKTQREERLSYLVLPVSLHSRNGLLADKINLEFKIVMKCVQVYTNMVSQTGVSWSRTENASSLLEDNRQMLMSGSCSDFRFFLPHWAWKKDVHKFILASRSPVLRAMIESQMTEAASNELVLLDTQPAAVIIFIQLLYLGKMEVEEGQASLRNIFDAAVLCDKFGRPDFADLCCSICKSLFIDAAPAEVVLFLSRSRCYDFAKKARDCALDVLAQKADVQKEIKDIQVMQELLEHFQKRMCRRIAGNRSDVDDQEMSEDSRASRRRRLR